MDAKYIVHLIPKKTCSFYTTLTLKSCKVLTRITARNTYKISCLYQKIHTNIPIIAFVVDPDGSETVGIPNDYFKQTILKIT